MPDKGKGVKDIDHVGIAWVHLVGATIFFGADNDWGKTWRTAGSWKSPYVKAVVYQGDAVSITWKDASNNGTGKELRTDQVRLTRSAVRP